MKAATFFLPRHHRAHGRRRAALSVLLSTVLVFLGLPMVAFADDNDAELSLEHYVGDHQGEVPTFSAGDHFTFKVDLQCSSFDSGYCKNAVLVSQLPAPLEYENDPVTVSPNVATSSINGRKLTVSFTGTGLQAGVATSVSIRVVVPQDALGDFDGTTVRNQVSVTASNADAVADTASVKLDIPTTLKVTASKTVAPAASQPAVPGRPVSFAVAAVNHSNVSVDALRLTDPTGGASPFDTLAVTGLSALLVPDGATKVQLDWYDGAAWHDGSARAIPDDPDDLLPSDPAAIKGLRVSFAGAGEAALPPGAKGGVTIRTSSRDGAFTGLDAGSSQEVANEVTAGVDHGSDAATDKASASIAFTKQDPSVSLTKSFSSGSLVSGKSATVTLTANNAVMPVSSMEIADPQAGKPSLADQGLTFTGFVGDDVDWPAGATAASVTYRYTDGSPASETTTTTATDTLPAPDPARRVAGFTVRFTADSDGIDSRASAVLPFTVTADAVDTEAGTSITNTAGAAVVTAAQDRATATADDDLTLLPVRVQASAEKTFTRGTIWGTPGTTDTVRLASQVATSSTIGSTRLDVVDVDTPATDSATATTFWDNVDLRTIHSTAVPAGTTLTVSYFDGASWQPLTDAVAGPVSDWHYTPTAAQKAVIAGLKFSFTPTDPTTLLQPGFAVAPRFDVALRQSLRSDPATSTTAAGIETALVNTATTTVANPDAIATTATESASDTVTLKPRNSTGDGSLWLVTKRWVDPVGGSQVGAGSVSALSDASRTAVLAWGTDGLSLSRLQLVDDPHYGDVASSFYDAFNLTAIEPITTAIDPEIGQDKVSKVELYSSAVHDWVDITTAACANGCDGGFGGYTLSADERATTLAVRISFAAGSDSDTGEIALSTSADRQVKLDYQLRRTLRSDPGSYVLGDRHSHSYNSGSAGTVVNTAGATGTLTEAASDGSTTVATSDTASMGILDQPLNVSLTKTNDQTSLGLPQSGNDDASYPLLRTTLKATNQTASFVPQLSITDPSPAVTGLGAYDRLNLYQIQFTGLPANLDAGYVSVHLTFADGSTADHSYDQAIALTPAQLAQVVGIRIDYGAAANLADPSKALIAAGAGATAVLTYQLRSHLRSDPTVAVSESDTVTNVARAQVVSAGGIGCVGESTCQDEPSDDDSASVSIVQPTYAVTASKTINWPSRWEDQPAAGYQVTLAGQPTGTARTQSMLFTDADPTFFNAFSLVSLPTLTLPTPVNQVQLSVLTQVTYDNTGGQLGYRCGADPDLTACWHAASPVTADANGQVSLSLPDGITADQVRGVRIQAQRVVDGHAVQWERPADPKLSVTFGFSRRATLLYGPDGGATTPVPTDRAGQPTAPGESGPGLFTDTAAVTGTAAWEDNAAPYTDTEQVSASTTVKHRVNQISVQKTPGQGTGSQAPRYDLGAPIPYQLTIANTGSWAMTGLTIADQITPVGALVPADDATVYSAKVNGATVTGFGFSLDAATGLLTITPPTGFVLPAGSVLLIATNLRFRDRLDRGTEVDNAVTVGSDRPFEKCDHTTDAISQTSQANVARCASSTTVVVAASTPMAAVKSVKGDGAGAGTAPAGVNDDDLGVISVGNADATGCASPDLDGFYAYPCVPITKPGGRETWQVALTNNGNVAANVISVIDVLPAVGDTGVTLNSARKSKFATTLLGNVRAILPDDAPAHTLRTYFTTTAGSASCNKSDLANDTKPGGQSTCGTDWQLFTDATPAGTLADAAAVKFLLSFDDPNDGLVSGDSLKLRFDTRTPASAAMGDTTAVDPIAWNSVGIGSRTADSVSYPARASLITEPRKAGVAIAQGRLALRKVVAAPTSAWTGLLPSAYPVTVSCSDGSDQIPLHGTSAGSDAGAVTLAADGTVLAYNDDGGISVPLGATCSLSEKAGQGAVASYSADAIAGRDYSAIANVAHGYNAGAPGAVTVTNTYHDAGFTVTKNLAGPTAHDAAGNDVVFKDYNFTAGCQFLGAQVVAAADRSFTLAAGASKAFTGLPAGATCSVVETDAHGAASTTIALTQNGSAIADADPTDAAAGFTLAAGDATATSVAVTNTRTVSGVTITKLISGADQWADQQFTAHLECTSADVAGQVAYSGDVTLTKASPTRTVANLPTGASCTVTETKTGGATASSVSGGSFTVGDDPADPAEVSITNSFSTGSVQVTKTVKANGAAISASPWADRSFPVTLACTRPVDGVATAVTVPGGATRNLTRAGGWQVSYTELPTGASCAVTEGSASIDGQPDPVVTVTGPVTVGDGTTAAIGVTNDYTAGLLAITKTLTGVGAGFFAGSSFDVSCTLDGYADPVFTRTGVAVTKATLSSGTLGPIPFGASCTVTETANGGADATPSAQTVTVSPSAANANITAVGFTNTFSAGSVTITKALDGNAAAASWATGATFSVAVKCGLAAAGPYSYDGTITIKGGQAVTLGGASNPTLFPLGTHCWASETNAQGAVATALTQNSFANGVVVQASPGAVQPLAIPITNTYTYGGFTVTKTIVTPVTTNPAGTALVYSPSFAFSAKCTFNGATVLDTTFSLTRTGGGNWSSQGYQQLPTGAGCTVKETNAAGASKTEVKLSVNGVDGTTTTAATTSFTLAAGDQTTTTVGFTNTYGSGTIQVKKVISGSTTWATADFTVHLKCTASFVTSPSPIFETDFTFHNGVSMASPTLTLPANTSCVTSEAATQSGGANNQAVNGPTTTIASGSDKTVTVTNTFATGSVTVTKVLQVNQVATTAEPWASGSYTVTLHCTRSVNGATETLTVPSATQQLAKTNATPYAYTWSGLPQGATCWAGEDALSYPANTPDQPSPTSTTLSPATVQVPSGTAATQTVTNNFAFGGLTVTKSLTGDGAAAWASGSFRFDVACTLAGSSGTVFTRTVTLQRSNAGQTTLTSDPVVPIPVGSQCSVTESGTGGATSVTPAGATVALTDPIAPGAAYRDAAFTNTFRNAGFTVTKTVDNGGAKDADGHDISYKGSYGFTASCLFNGTQALADADRAFSLTAGASKAFSQLPAGASCTVTETSVAGVPSTSVTLTQGASTPVDATATATGAFTLVAGDATATAVGFTNHYTTGGLDITKAVAGDGATAWAGGTFTLGLSCTLDDDANTATAAATVYSATHTLRKGDTWSVRNLPTGAACTVSEPKSAGANATGFTNGTPTVTTANQAVTVTNTFTTGAVKVTKAITANGADAGALAPWKDGNYPVTLHCAKDIDDDGAADALSITGASQSITGAGSYTWTGLPTGATCTVTEGTSAVTGQPQPVASSGSVTVVAGSTGTLALTNAFTAGKLVIHKDITGDAATTWGVGPFGVQVSCALDGVSGTVFTKAVTLTPTAGQTALDSAALGPIPVGSRCAVTETAAAGATTVAVDDPVTIALNASTSNVTTVDVTNTFRFAGFTVTKAVTSDALDAAGSAIGYRAAGFTASCQFKGAEAVPLADRSFILAAGGSKTFSGLPAGAVCTVTETDTAGAASTTTAITAAGSPVADANAAALATGFTLVPGGADAMTVGYTNAYTTGSVRVGKVTAGNGASAWADAYFTARLVCTLADASSTTVFDASHTVTTAAPWDVTALPTSAACAVTETASGAANATSISGGTFTVGTGRSDVTITNTYTLGAVRVTKNLTVNSVTASTAPWKDGTYTVALSCTRPVNGVDVAIAVPGGASRSITGAGTATFPGLPTGAHCSLAESGSAPAAQQTTVAPSGVTIGDDQAQPQTFSVSNDFHTASLSILKQLAGAGQADFGSGPFEFAVDCTLAGVSGKVFQTTAELSRPAGSTVTSLTSSDLGPVPVGALCTVSESDAGGADATPDPVTITVAEDAAANVATFTNRFSAGTVWLSKTLDGAAAAEAWATGATFSVDVTCQVKVGGVTGTVLSRTVQIAGGQRLNVTGVDGRASRVPLGSHCWANETDAGGAGAHRADQDGYDNAAVVTGGTPASLQALELGVTNTYQYAGFTVTKAVDNGGAIDAAGQAIGYPAAFGFTANCSLNGSSVLSQSFTLLAGGSRSFEKLPAGASCTVAETATGHAAGTTVQVTQNGTAAAEQNLTSASLTLQRGGLFAAQSPSVNQLAFTNHYTTGAVSVTKQVAGAGADAWGNDGFDLELSCTADTDADAATPAVNVYDRTVAVSKANPTWTVADLPTGASCTVRETASGGANTHSDPQVVQVGSDPANPAEASITNTFTTGSVLVAKHFTVNGADPSTGWADQLASGSYQVTLSCARQVNGSAETLAIPGGAERTVTAGTGWEARYAGLPTGAQCSVTETSASPAPQSVSYSSTQVTVPAGSDPVELGLTNDYVTGSLKVVKRVTGDGAAFGLGPFDFDISCTLPGLADPVFTRTGLQLSAGSLTSSALGPIPVGASCRVSESRTGGATTAASDATVVIAIAADTANTATVTMTNSFGIGGFTVTKTVDAGGAVDADGNAIVYPIRYSFAANCGFDGAALELAATDTTFALADGQSHQFSGLPQGARCTVAETGSGQSASTTVTTNGSAPLTATSAELRVGADAGTVAFTNHYQVGAATITKQVTGAGAETWGNGPFTLHASCTLDTDADAGTAPVTVFDATTQVTRTSPTWKLTDLPSGADCTVAETKAGGATTAADQAGFTVTSDPAHPTVVILTNDFATGTVNVTNHILVDGTPSAAAPYAGATYTVALTCTQQVDQVRTPVAIPGGSTRVISGAGTAQFTDLPLGASCAVSEPATSLDVPPDQITLGDDVTVGADPVATDVTNAFFTGTLVLHWTLQGVGTQFAGPAEFSVDCTLPGAGASVFHTDLTLTPTGGGTDIESAPLGPIPVGASCTVTQFSAKGAITTALPAVVAGSTAEVTATLVNNYAAGRLAVVKRLAGSGADEHGSTTFTIAVTCQGADTSDLYSGTVTITGSGSATVNEGGDPVLLPGGSHCWAAETDSGGAASSVVDHGSSDAAVVVDSVDAGELQQLTITVTNSFAATTDSRLAFTGAGGMGLAVAGLVAMGLGIWLVRSRRRAQS